MLKARTLYHLFLVRRKGHGAIEAIEELDRVLGILPHHSGAGLSRAGIRRSCLGAGPDHAPEGAPAGPSSFGHQEACRILRA